MFKCCGGGLRGEAVVGSPLILIINEEKHRIIGREHDESDGSIKGSVQHSFRQV